MRVEVLYFEGCPNVRATVDRLQRALQERGLTPPVAEIPVVDEEMAQELRFPGSPTVRINGLDIDPPARGRTAFGIACRTYEGGQGIPSEALIRRAVSLAVGSSG